MTEQCHRSVSVRLLEVQWKPQRIRKLDIKCDCRCYRMVKLNIDQCRCEIEAVAPACEPKRVQIQFHLIGAFFLRECVALKVIGGCHAEPSAGCINQEEIERYPRRTVGLHNHVQ